MKQKLAAASGETSFTLFEGNVSFDPDSLEAREGSPPAIPSFNLQAYNGGKMKPAGFRFPVVVDLEGMSHDRRVPAFMDHNTSGSGVVGHAEVEITDAVHAKGIVSGETDAAKTVVESAKKGFPWQVSIGATIDQKLFVKSGDSRVINGERHNGPFHHVRKSHLHEVSFVPIGADNTTTAAIAAQQRSKEMPDSVILNAKECPEDTDLKEWLQTNKYEWKKFRNYLDDEEMVWAELDEEAQDKCQRAFKAKMETERKEIETKTEADLLADMRKTTADEIGRHAAIRKLTRFDADMQAKAIAEGWTPEKTELELLRVEYRQRPKSTNPGGRGEELNSRVIEAAIATQVGIEAKWLDNKSDHWQELKQRGYTEQELDKALDAGEYSFSRLFHEYLYANGISVSPGTTIQELIPKVKDCHRQIKASTGFSTIDISGILSNVMGKSMLASFNNVRPVAQRISSSRPVPDFKETKAFRLTGNGDFLPVGPDGELQSMSLQEEEYPNKPITYGRLLGVSRTMLINDDLGALTGVTQILGRKAATKLQKTVFELWLTLQDKVGQNGNPFFSAGNSNLITGAGSALSIDALTAAEKLFMEQTDADGDPIDLEATILLVPPALKVPAENHMESTTSMVYDRDTGATETNRGPVTNPHVGKWAIDWSPWLTAGRLTNGSDTKWWLLAPPNVLAAVEIVYLNGRQTPIIESEDSDFQTLGFQWRSYYDFGVAEQDYRAAVQNDGA